MQRPRRTSEFHDEQGVVGRNSRSLQRNNLAPSPSSGSGMAGACTGGTGKKYNVRQSRIAVPTRASSGDRLSNNNLYLPIPTSTVKRGVTPQKTPLPKTPANRVLFTAEKQRLTPAVNSNLVPLYNDKKWVHDATQRITEHLLKQGTLNGGMSTDFLSRGLRQMSIKQFVATVNYFLGHIWGNRFVVGSNHVEDIISILQKLKYPYTLNKSWLKTPNTQHSFGNVVILLDFLMEFVADPEESLYQEEKYFDFVDPTDFKEDRFQMPDFEFQRQLLSNSEKGFSLWDKQKIEEFNNLKRKTCNTLLQKKCNVANLEEMELEIQKTTQILELLENERLPEDRDMLKLQSQLSRDLKNLNHDIKSLQIECEKNKRNIKEVNSHKMIIMKEVDTIEKEIKNLQDRLSKQSCTIEQRDQMIENVMQYKHMLAIKERTVQDLQNRYHNEQIFKSKAIKQLSDQIEKLNAHMREIAYSNVVSLKNDTSLNYDSFELCLRPDKSDVKKIQVQLEQIKQVVLQNIYANKKKTNQLQDHCKLLKTEVEVKLYPKLNALKTSHSNRAADLQLVLHNIEKEESQLLETLERLEEDLMTAENTTKELQNLIKNKSSLLEELMASNEQTMKLAEDKHQQSLEKRKDFLKAYDKILDECIESDAMQQLENQVQLQEKQLEELMNFFFN